MKRSRAVLCMLLVAALPVWGGTPLLFNINGIRKDGILRAGLYRKGDAFLKPGGEFLRATAEANALETALISWTNVPFGTYALALYLDINRNGKADRGLLGIPLEPFGFYRQVKIFLVAPRFEDCAFEVTPTSHIFHTDLQAWAK